MEKQLSSSKHDNKDLICEKITDDRGEERIRNYIQGRQLGKGGFARVYAMTDLETKLVYAAKIVPKTSLQ